MEMKLSEEIKSRLNGKWEPSPGMVYPLLRELEEEGYVTGWWEEPDKDLLDIIALPTKDISTTKSYYYSINLLLRIPCISYKPC